MKIPKYIQADLALVGITFIWGSTFTIVKRSLAQVSPVFFVAIRFWVAAVILSIAMPGQLKQIPRKAICQGFILSLMLLGGFVFQTLGLRNTNPSYSAFITSLSVLLVPLVGFLLFRHRPRPQTLAGVILATFGLFLMLVHEAELNLKKGDLLTLVCAILFAFHILLLGRFVTISDFKQLALVQIFFTALLCTILVPVLETPFVTWDGGLLFSLFVTGVLATALALFVQTWAQRLTTAYHAALIFSLEPLFAALFAYWILGQVLTSREWLGSTLILAGILISEARAKN
jgi:drug/metabolite transporter (DMT)-like permease